MDVTGKEIAEWARDEIGRLSRQPEYKSLLEVEEAISAISGLSVSWIQKFYQRAKRNPTLDTLDRLTAAIKVLTKRGEKASDKTAQAA